MSQRDESFEPTGEEHSEFVAVVFARSIEEAELLRELLGDHDIPAIVGLEEEGEGGKKLRRGMSRGVPILVPEVFLDEASEIIADREDIDEFEEQEGEEEEEEEEEEFLTEEVVEGQEEFEAEDLEEEELEEEEEEEEEDDEFLDDEDLEEQDDEGL